MYTCTVVGYIEAEQSLGFSSIQIPI